MYAPDGRRDEETYTFIIPELTRMLVNLLVFIVPNVVAFFWLAALVLCRFD